MKTYRAGANLAVSIGGILLAASIFIANVAPVIHSAIPWFGPDHQKVAMALGVMLAAIGSILAHQAGTQSTQDLREEVRESGVPVAPEPIAKKEGTG